MQRYLVHVTGKGIVGVQHRTGLEAALARPLQVVFGTELYPTVPGKIAALVHSIITTHVFVDANKRTAMALGLALAEANGQLIQAMIANPVSRQTLVTGTVGRARLPSSRSPKAVAEL